jgi:hypothetical protein
MRAAFTAEDLRAVNIDPRGRHLHGSRRSLLRPFIERDRVAAGCTDNLAFAKLSSREAIGIVSQAP